MRQSSFEGLVRVRLRPGSCPGCPTDPEASDDAELKRLVHDLALTLFNHLERDDADILARSELRGQTVSQIARETVCSRAEATRRLDHARRCLCQLVVLTLVPAKHE